MTLGAQAMTSHNKVKYYVDVQCETQCCAQIIIVYKQGICQARDKFWPDKKAVQSNKIKVLIRN